jgi:hypothetical protein
LVAKTDNGKTVNAEIGRKAAGPELKITAGELEEREEKRRETPRFRPKQY